MKTKIVLFLTAFLLLGSVVFAGGESEGTESEDLGYGFNKTGFPIVDEPITLTMMGRRHPVHVVDWSEMEFFKDMEELTNIKFEFNTPLASEYNEKKQLAFASGNLPDVFVSGFISANEEVEYGNQGVLISLNDLIDNYMPNFQDRMDDFEDMRSSITTLDGNIYALPHLDLRRVYPLWINGKWLSNLGLDMPTTTDELYEVLLAFRTEDPNQNGQRDEIPMTGRAGNAGGHIFKQLLNSFGLIFNGIQVIDDKVVYAPLEPEYKEFLMFANKLWERDLLDHDVFTQSNADYKAKIAGGVVGMCTEAWPRTAWPDASESIENFNSYPAVPCLTSPVNDQKLMYMSPVIKRGMFAITDECKYPEAIIRWVDYLYGLDGLSKLHGEGYMWEWVDKGNRTIKPLTDGLSGQEQSKITPRPGTYFPTYGPAWFDRVGTTPIEMTTVDLMQQSKSKQFEEKYYPYTTTEFPLTYITQEEQEKISEISGDLNSYVYQMDKAFIGGEEPFSNYDEYIEQLVKLGAEELVEIYTAVYERWKNL
jgi:putative aldouronate transport system substrate-binding protein